MSIIQEALKKAEATYTKKTFRTNNESTEEVTSPDIGAKDAFPDVARRTTMPLAAPIPVVIVLTIIIGFGLKTFFSNTTTPTTKTTPKEVEPVKKVVMEKVSTPPKNVFAMNLMASQHADLTLNGIMYVREKPRAIINGNVVEVGESVGGAKVTAINEGSVLLNYNDREITLKLKE